VKSTKLGELEDFKLLHQYTSGDLEAFQVLFHRYKKPLYNFILHQIGDAAVAEDLLQEAFLRVIQRATDFRGDSKFTTWLYTITRNLCVDHLRKKSIRQHASLDAPSSVKLEKGLPLIDRVANQHPGAEREVTAKRLQEQISEAVDNLPEEQREVFLMRQVQQLQFQEIATVVGVSENTVKSRMRYALERLREALSAYEDYTRQLG